MTRKATSFSKDGVKIYILDDVLRPLAVVDATDGVECEKICAILKRDYHIESVENVDADHLDLIDRFEDHINGL